MLLYLFTFTQPDRTLSSARVAARSRAAAAAVMGGVLSRPLVGAENTHPEPGTILVVFGKIDREEEGLVSAVSATGEMLVPA